VFVDTIPPTFERVYGIVLEAQRRAIRKVGPGVAAGRVDRAARDFIKAHRHGSHFGHGVGHGLGIEIHEMPTLNARSKTALKPGMVITVEPGIYLPGRGGVRIEDDVLVTRTGSLVLTTLPKSLRDMLIRT
jgi:Xaa-Pro aminopeptidase